MLAGRPAIADDVADWIAAQPEPFRYVLEAGQKEAVFALYREQCPAELFRRLRPYSKGTQDCSERPGWCLALCRAGQGRACFGLARTIELELADAGEATLKYPFFMAACAAGHANGCTNAGAAAKNGDWIEGTQVTLAASRACQFRTYETACEAEAPWGCFMLGMEWAFEGVAGQTDINAAMAAWRRACDLDPNSSACESSTSRLTYFAE